MTNNFGFTLSRKKKIFELFYRHKNLDLEHIEIPYGNGVRLFFYQRRLVKRTSSQLVYAAA
jgi:hypothetical protein